MFSGDCRPEACFRSPVLPFLMVVIHVLYMFCACPSFADEFVSSSSLSMSRSLTAVRRLMDRLGKSTAQRTDVSWRAIEGGHPVCCFEPLSLDAAMLRANQNPTPPEPGN